MNKLYVIVLYLCCAMPLCSVMPIVTLYHCCDIFGIQRTIHKRSLLSDAMKRMDEEKPLELPACFSLTNIISLKTKGMEIRRRYNIRYNLCQKLKEHLDEMDECGYVEKYTQDKVLQRIREVEESNEELKKQFDAIASYLEEQRAKNVEQKYAESADETLRALEHQNDEILQRIALPLNTP